MSCANTNLPTYIERSRARKSPVWQIKAEVGNTPQKHYNYCISIDYRAIKSKLSDSTDKICFSLTRFDTRSNKENF